MKMKNENTIIEKQIYVWCKRKLANVIELRERLHITFASLIC